MKTKLTISTVAISLAFVSMFVSCKQQAKEVKQTVTETPAPKYAADAPENILTPDKVETELLGTLDFFDGLPSKATAAKTYDFLDISRGVHTFLTGMPAASIQAMLEGLKGTGLKPGDIGICESLMDARTLFLTPNSTTQYITERDTPRIQCH